LTDALMAASASAQAWLDGATSALQTLNALLPSATAQQGNTSVVAAAARVSGALSTLASSAPGFLVSLNAFTGAQPLGSWTKADQVSTAVLLPPAALTLY